MLISSMPNVRYLSGFSGTDATLLIARHCKILFTDSRYTTQARDQAPAFRIITYKRKVEEIAGFIKKSRIKRLGYEPDRITQEAYRQYRRHLRGVRLIPLLDMIEKMRARKSGHEIKKIRRACRIAGQAFEGLFPQIAPGICEKEIALELEYRMRKAGSGPAAFETIVASGKRAALPHGIASKKKLRPGDMIILDFGASFDGYFSDQTITLCLGRPGRKLKEVYEVVREAQARALARIRHGAEIREVDAAARDFIAMKGYGRYFSHGLGHGVGLEVHEEPALNPQSTGCLKQGMIVTVEPGIYLPGWGGVRIEDMALVTKTGCRILTRSSGPIRAIP